MKSSNTSKNYETQLNNQKAKLIHTLETKTYTSLTEITHSLVEIQSELLKLAQSEILTQSEIQKKKTQPTILEKLYIVSGLHTQL